MALWALCRRRRTSVDIVVAAVVVHLVQRPGEPLVGLDAVLLVPLDPKVFDGAGGAIQQKNFMFLIWLKSNLGCLNSSSQTI